MKLEKCPYKFNPNECLKSCIRYEGCLMESEKGKPIMGVAKRVEPWPCPYGKGIDCQHVLANGGCNRRTYANRKPDHPCTSYLRKPKVKL